MMKAEYRNATRSKKLIKEAYISLLREKPATKITVTDIVKTANISRGTFYAHYLDTYDLLVSFQRDFFQTYLGFIQKHHEPKLVDQLDCILDQIVEIMHKNYETYCILANQDFSFDFYDKLINVTIDELKKEYHIDEETKRTLNICLNGFMLILRSWINDPDFQTINDYSNTLKKLLHKGIVS